jgi:hypothetical protein
VKKSKNQENELKIFLKSPTLVGTVKKNVGKTIEKLKIDDS